MSSQQYIGVGRGTESGLSRPAMIVRATIELLAGREPVRPIGRWQPTSPNEPRVVLAKKLYRDLAGDSQPDIYERTAERLADRWESDEAQAAITKFLALRE